MTYGGVGARWHRQMLLGGGAPDLEVYIRWQEYPRMLDRPRNFPVRVALAG